MRLSRLVTALVVLGLGLPATHPAKAAIMFYDAGSYVSITEGRTDGTQGAFRLRAANGSLQFDQVLEPTNGDGGCCAHAEEHYGFTSTGFSGSGNISTSGFGADAQSLLYISFEVTQPTAFHLDGLVYSFGYSYFAGDAPGQVLSGPFSFSGELQPGGFYEIHIFAGQSPGQPLSQQYQFTLTVPEPSFTWLLLASLTAVPFLGRQTRADSWASEG